MVPLLSLAAHLNPEWIRRLPDSTRGLHLGAARLAEGMEEVAERSCSSSSGRFRHGDLDGAADVMPQNVGDQGW